MNSNQVSAKGSQASQQPQQTVTIPRSHSVPNERRQVDSPGRRKLIKNPAPFTPPVPMPNDPNLIPQIEPLLTRLSDEKLHLLLSLFDIPVAVERPINISLFINEGYNKYINVAPALQMTLLTFIEQLNTNTEIISKLKNNRTYTLLDQ